MSDEEVEEIMKATDTKEDIDGNIKFAGEFLTPCTISELIQLFSINTDRLQCLQQGQETRKNRKTTPHYRWVFLSWDKNYWSYDVALWL